MNTHEKNNWKAPLVKGMFALTLLTAFTGNALASTPAGDRPIQVVQFADLNLSRPAGVSALYQRIRMAANGVCDSSGNREMAQFVRWHLCLDHAIAHAVADLSIPALTQYHAAKTGRIGELATVAKLP